MDEKQKKDERVGPEGVPQGPTLNIGRSFLAFGVCILLMIVVGIYEWHGNKQRDKANSAVTSARLSVDAAKNAQADVKAPSLMAEASQNLELAESTLSKRKYGKAAEFAKTANAKAKEALEASNKAPAPKSGPAKKSKSK